MNITPANFSHVNTAYSSNPYTAPLSGMKQAQATAQDAGTRIARGEITPENIVSLNTSLYSFKANAVVIKSLDQMQGTLLDVLA